MLIKCCSKDIPLKFLVLVQSHTSLNSSGVKFSSLGSSFSSWNRNISCHDDAIKEKHFPRYWPFVRGIHRSSVNSPHKGQWRGALMFSLICVWISFWVNNREAGDLRRYRAHYVVIVITLWNTCSWPGFTPSIFSRHSSYGIPWWRYDDPVTFYI